MPLMNEMSLFVYMYIVISDIITLYTLYIVWSLGLVFGLILIF